MRVAVISDIHGSFWALDAVLKAVEHESPDLIVHGGDLALNGPRPAEVVDLIKERGFPGVVGNTDELLWKPEVRAEQEARMPKLRRLLYVLFEETAGATRELLGAERLDWLRGLPTQWRVEDLVVVHASPVISGAPPGLTPMSKHFSPPTTLWTHLSWSTGTSIDHSSGSSRRSPSPTAVAWG